MGERLTVTITATDGASRTFTTVANSAKRMGDEIERAGTEGARGLRQVDTQAKTTGRSLVGLGAAFGALVSATSLLGTSYREQQRQIDGINRLYGEQADEILAVSDRIQEMTRYSDDAARESFLLASSLVGNYQLSTENLEVLIERSADLAQIYGFTLPDAVQRTSSALRGEGESAERLGLNMSDAAIAAAALDAGITNWNVPGALTEAERAAFRFQVFLDQTAASVGAASDATATAGGRFRQFMNDVQDAGQAVGGFLGPVGEVAAELAPLAIAAPIVGAGLGSLVTAARSGALVMGALSVATNPVVLGFGALALAGYGVYKILQNIEESASGVAEGMGLLADEIERLQLAAQPEAAAQVQSIVDAIQAQVDLLKGEDLAEITANLGLPPGTDLLQIMAPGGLNDQLAQAGSSVDELAAHIITTLGTLGPEAQQAYLDWINGLLLTIEHTAEGSNLDDIINEILITPASEVPGVLDAVNESATGAAGGLDTLTASTNAAGIAMYGQVAAAQEANRQYAELQKNIEAFEDATQEWLGQGDNFLDFWLQYQNNLREAQQEQAALNESSEKAAPAMRDFVSETELAFQPLVELAARLDDASAALDSVLNTFNQIDSLGQRAETAGSIAENLIGEPGAWATIDDLLESGRISIEEYNQALAAGYDIQRSNAAIQEDLNAMRAAQLPLLAEELDAYERNIDAIAQLPPLEQRRALAMQDSAVQAQLASQYSTAYAASLGEIPEEVATNMIVSAAEADPILKDLLLQFGLIEEGADGTISVNFPDGPTVQESITELTRSIDALIVAIGGVPPVHITAVDEASPVIATAEGNLNGLDGESATVDINADDNASGVIATVRTTLRNLDGSSATTYVNTITTQTMRTIYETRGLGPTQRHGGIPGMAMGGVLFEGAEAGYEMAHFATGGTALLPARGIYDVPPNTYISPHNAQPNGLGGTTVNLYVAGSIVTEQEIIGRAAEAIWSVQAEEGIRQRLAAGMV